jgi:hypothetical protein
MGRKCFFSNRIFLFSTAVFFTLVLASCSKPQIRFDGVYNPDNATNVIAIDTFSVQVSSVFLDSFPTNGTKTQLLGKYIDPFFGTITSQSYTDIGTPAFPPSITNYSTYDSIVLIMRIDRTFYGDTSNVQGFLVSQLTQTMNFPANQTAFYNNSSIPYNPTVLGSAYVKIRPLAGVTSQLRGDSIVMTMPNSMGEALFGLLYRQPDTLTNPTQFREYFKGLTVYPDPNYPGATYGFKDTLTLRIYYHEPGVVAVNQTVDFPTVNQFSQFNEITADRTGTPLASISHANPEIQSTATSNQAFLQPITSIYTKLLFPTISNLLGYQDYLAVMKAQLVIKPIAGTYSPSFALPPAVNLALTNEGNTIGTVLPYGSGSLNIDYLYGTNTSYSYDITTYIQGALNQGAASNAKNGLILITPSTLYNTTFNRAVIGNAYNSLLSNQISLIIYYASYY